MILICDTEGSDRAINLRERLFRAGIPTAISVPSTIKKFAPFKLIITFTDVFEQIRRLPYDDIFVVAIGNGFVNTALNAVGIDNIDNAISYAKNHLFEQFEISESALFQSGICFSGVFLSEKFFQLFGNIVIPTDTEYMIFKYLLFCTNENTLTTTSTIAAFCYSSQKKIDSNVLAAHISNINKKIYDSYGKKIIKSKRFEGYYIDKI